MGFRDYLKALGVAVVPDRVVWEGTHVSGAGVSAGSDVALSLTERVHGREVAEALQLIIEYDPEPPFNSGSFERASPRTRRLAKRIMLGISPCAQQPSTGGRWCGPVSAAPVTRA